MEKGNDVYVESDMGIKIVEEKGEKTETGKLEAEI